MKKAIVLLSAVAASAAFGVHATTAEAQPPVAPEWVRIDRISANGSGCPAGTVTAAISPDRQAVTLTFADFDASVAPGLDPARSSEFCGINLLLNYPGGWSFSIVTADYEGRVNLGPRVVGQQTSTYWFQGQLGRPRFATTIVGPAFGPYFRRDTLGTGAIVWSPCGARRYLNIDSDVSVSNMANPSASGFMNVKYLDVTVQVTYGLTWRLC